MIGKITARIVAVLCVAVALGGAQAHAANVYSQSPPGGLGRISDFAAPVVNQQAQRFTLASGDGIQTIAAWGFCTNGLLTDDFTVRLFADSGGGPAVTPFEELTGASVMREPTELTALSGEPIYRYTFPLPAPVILSSGTDYYVSIVNDTTVAEPLGLVDSYQPTERLALAPGR